MPNCRNCGDELSIGGNWYPSRAKRNSRICIACDKARCRQYYQMHREDILESRRQHYEGYRERMIGRSRRWQLEHPLEHAEYKRNWCKENPEKVREKSRRRRARKNGATIGPVDEAALYKRDGYRCLYCGATDNLTLDHVAPLAEDGSHCEENLVVACKPCNSSKGTKPLEDWLQTQPKALAWVM